MKKIKSAGGIIVRNEKGIKQILVFKRHEGGVAFPKGHVEPGEEFEEAALREVFEETGLKAKIVKLLGVVERHGHDSDYSLCNKEIHYFLMEADAKANPESKREVIWEDIESIQNKLLYKEERKFLAEIIPNL